MSSRISRWPARSTAGAVTIPGNLTVNGTVTASGTITASGAADTTTNQTVGGTLGVTGVTTLSSSLIQGSNTTDRVTIKGIYKNPSAISVSIPSIADNAAENIDSVAVDVSAAFSIQPAVGDAVIPIPLAALPTDCLLLSAYVTATDQITVVVGSKEAGAGVTGAAVNFDFLIFDLT